MNINKNYPCACCGFLTISNPEPGTYEICPICFWEDDNVQFDDIDYKGGVWKNKNNTLFFPTTKGTIHYCKNGAHIVPAYPD